jgi:hypothetical protein
MGKIMGEIFVVILTRENLQSDEFGRSFIKTLSNTIPELTPDFYGNWEPIRNPFNPYNEDAILSFWKYPFLWEKKKPKSIGCFFMVPNLRNPHNAIIFSIKNIINLEELIKLFLIWCGIMKPDFACITKLTDYEIDSEKGRDVLGLLNPQKMVYTFHMSGHTLKKYIPDVYWLTVFGQPYVSLFGKDKLLSAPAFSVSELDNSAIMIQLSENLDDLEHRTEEIGKARSIIKTHLNNNAFFDLAKGKDAVYNTPWK